MPLNIFAYLNHLDQERNRAAILHASPEMGTSVTKFAQKVCRQAGGKYLDLLDLFIQNAELSAKVDSFSPEKFRALLIEQAKGTGLLFIDRTDFILDTWRRGERQDFFRMVDKQWDGYKDGMKAKLLVILQTSPEIEALQIVDSQSQTRVLRLSDFNDIL